MTRWSAKCASCGQYIPVSEMEAGGAARFEYTPSSEFTDEKCEWTCGPCNTPDPIEERAA